MPKPPPAPADLVDEETGAVLKDWRDELPGDEPAPGAREPEYEGTPPDPPRPEPGYRPRTRRRPRRTSIGQANRVLGGVGAALLLIGQFLPMVNAPFGIWMSFVDLPWKAATIGLGAVAEARDEGDRPAPPPAPRQVDRAEKRPDNGPGVVTIVVLVGTLYPIAIAALVAVAFFRLCGGADRKVLLVTGLGSLSATILYGGMLLALSAQKDFRAVMTLTSPGFGWAIVLVGGMALTGAGVIRPESRN